VLALAAFFQLKSPIDEATMKPIYFTLYP